MCVCARVYVRVCTYGNLFTCSSLLIYRLMRLIADLFINLFLVYSFCIILYYTVKTVCSILEPIFPGDSCRTKSIDAGLKERRSEIRSLNSIIQYGVQYHNIERNRTHVSYNMVYSIIAYKGIEQTRIE